MDGIKVTQLPVEIVNRPPNALEATQLCVEVVNRPPNNLKATQLNVEVVNRPPNNLKCTQLCVEVAIATYSIAPRVGRTYTIPLTMLGGNSGGV